MQKLLLAFIFSISLPAFAESEKPSVQDFLCRSVFFQSGEFIKAGDSIMDTTAFTMGKQDQYRIHVKRGDSPAIFAVDSSRESDEPTSEVSAYFQPSVPKGVAFKWELPEGSNILKSIDIVDPFANQTFIAVPVSSPKPNRNDFASYLVLVEEKDGVFTRRIDMPLGTGYLQAAIDIQAYTQSKPNMFAMLRLTTANSFIFSIIEIIPNSADPKDYDLKTHFMQVLETKSATSPGYQLGHLKFDDIHFLTVVDIEMEQARVFNLETMSWDPASFLF